MRLVGEAVADFKRGDDEVEGVSEVKVELPVDAHLPHEYVPGERLRLGAYGKIARTCASAGWTCPSRCRCGCSGSIRGRSSSGRSAD